MGYTNTFTSKCIFWNFSVKLVLEKNWSSWINPIWFTEFGSHDHDTHKTWSWHNDDNNFIKIFINKFFDYFYYIDKLNDKVSDANLKGLLFYYNFNRKISCSYSKITILSTAADLGRRLNWAKEGTCYLFARLTSFSWNWQ